MSVSMLNVLEARQRITPWVRRTPLVASDWLSHTCNARVGLKLESLQPTHSFKVRGAFNAAVALRQRNNGQLALVTASTGNHGRATSYAARALALDCVVFAPATTPAVKLDGIRAAGATLMDDARSYEEAESAALHYAVTTDRAVTFLSGYNDPYVIAGNGTIALELFDDDPLIDVIVVPVGGGGLISGIALAAKSINPNVRIVGVEAANNPSMSTARSRGAVMNIDIEPTLADGMSGNNDPQTITFDFIQRYVDDILLVTEQEIASAIRELAAHEHLIAEGAGAVTTAALIAKRIDRDIAGRNIALVISGSNIDSARFTSIINHAV